MLDDQSQYVELVEPTDCYSLRGSVSERIPVQVGRPLNFEDWTVFQPGCAESERPTCGSQEGSIPWMLGWEWLTARMLKSSKCRQFKVNQDVPTSWTWQKGSGSQNVKIRNDWLHGCWKAVSAQSLSGCFTDLGLIGGNFGPRYQSDVYHGRDLVSGHTASNAPDPIWTPKLTVARPG